MTESHNHTSDDICKVLTSVSHMLQYRDDILPMVKKSISKMTTDLCYLLGEFDITVVFEEKPTSMVYLLYINVIFIIPPSASQELVILFLIFLCLVSMQTEVHMQLKYIHVLHKP